MLLPKSALKSVLLLSAAVLALSGCETVDKVMSADISPHGMINAARRGVAGARFKGKHIVSAYAELGKADDIQHGIIQEGKLKGQEGYVYTWLDVSQNSESTHYLGSGYHSNGDRTDYYERGVTNFTRYRYFITDTNHVIRDYKESEHRALVQ